MCKKKKKSQILTEQDTESMNQHTVLWIHQSKYSAGHGTHYIAHAEEYDSLESLYSQLLK